MNLSSRYMCSYCLNQGFLLVKTYWLLFFFFPLNAPSVHNMSFRASCIPILVWRTCFFLLIFFFLSSLVTTLHPTKLRFDAWRKHADLFMSASAHILCLNNILGFSQTAPIVDLYLSAECRNRAERSSCLLFEHLSRTVCHLYDLHVASWVELRQLLVG